MGKITRYLPPKPPRNKTLRNKISRRLPRRHLFLSLFLILNLVLSLVAIAGLLILSTNMGLSLSLSPTGLSPALSKNSSDLEIQISPDSTLEVSKNLANKNLTNKNLAHKNLTSRNINQDQSLPPSQLHPLPSTLQKWQDTNNSGDYFSKIKPTPAGYLVWSQFPVKIYITASNKLPKQQGQNWIETVSQAVNEWQNYLPLEIVTQPEIADIIIERKAPPLQFDRKRKISRARSAQTTYEFYTKNNTLYHRFTILLSPSQTGKYLLAATRHELGHALGIWGHSPVKSDALYFSQVRNPPLISPRDVNTLKRIYEQPTSLGWSLP